MGALSIVLTRGEELYDIVASRFLDAHLFESTILDICKDFTIIRPRPLPDGVSHIEAIAEVFNEEMGDVVHQFGEMAGFEPDEIQYAWDKWCYNNAPQVVGMVAQVLFKNQGACRSMLVSSDRMNVISPYQNELFPQFREIATSNTSQYKIWNQEVVNRE